MKRCEPEFLGLFLLLAVLFSNVGAQICYPWLENYESTIVTRIAAPRGYDRVRVEPGSFGDWLRHLPVKEGNPAVCLFNGDDKRNQQAHFIVLDIDVGEKDLQQCADAVIRLRAEYLYSIERFDLIKFKFTSGHLAEFAKWMEGFRVNIDGSRVRWERRAAIDSSYFAFRGYLETVFTYAGTHSLSRELAAVREIEDISIGDAFVQGGFPGHAVIVVDVAVDRQTGKRVFLLSQSYMPAQDVHILNNSMNSRLTPWYDTEFGEILQTPEWDFSVGDLMRFDSH